MNMQYIPVEKQFDSIFKNNGKKDYTFSSLKLGRRDRKIIWLLKEYGVSGKRCLDIGPGTGRWLQYLASNNADYLAAVDISAEALDNSKQYCNITQKINLEKDNFDFEDGFFDIVLCFMVLEHIAYPEKMLSELSRIMKRNSIILLTIPNILSFISRIKVLFGKLPIAITSDPTHIRFYCQSNLANLAKPFGFIIEAIPTSFSINPLNTKSLRLPSNKCLMGFDDHFLFKLTKD